jgi:Bacterial PH domain
MTTGAPNSKGRAGVAGRRCDHQGVKRPPPVRRFRHSSAITVAGVIGVITCISVASWQPYLLVLMAIPFAVALWSWRAGTDVDAEGLTVRAAVGRRRLPWSAIVGLEADTDRSVVAVLASGGRVSLTAVTKSDLPTLVEAAGAEVSAATPEADRHGNQSI